MNWDVPHRDDPGRSGYCAERSARKLCRGLSVDSRAVRAGPRRLPLFGLRQLLRCRHDGGLARGESGRGHTAHACRRGVAFLPKVFEAPALRLDGQPRTRHPLTYSIWPFAGPGDPVWLHRHRAWSIGPCLVTGESVSFVLVRRRGLGDRLALISSGPGRTS